MTGHTAMTLNLVHRGDEGPFLSARELGALLGLDECGGALDVVSSYRPALEAYGPLRLEDGPAGKDVLLNEEQANLFVRLSSADETAHVLTLLARTFMPTDWPVPPEAPVGHLD